MRFTNELFVKSFDKDVAEDEEAFVLIVVLNRRKKVKIAAKLLSEYENCQEYTPRKKEKEPKQSEQAHSIQEEMKVETITEEEARSLVRTGGACLACGLCLLPKPGLFRIRLRDLWCFLGTGIGSMLLFSVF